MTGLLALAPAPIAPLRSCADGRYDDALVSVRWDRDGVGPVFEAHADGARIVVTHRVRVAELDDELGGPLARTLAPLTTDRYAPHAWSRFYTNTLALTRRPDPPGYAGVYRHALGLLPDTSVLDLGCSFGFLALHLAARGATALACDVDPGTTALLARMAGRLGLPVDVHDDVAGVPDGAVDAVALLHVLEHVDDAAGRRLFADSLRIARHRVVVAVPYEHRPEPLFGHVRCLRPADLHELGAASGWLHSVHDHLGGWLVLDRQRSTRIKEQT